MGEPDFLRWNGLASCSAFLLPPPVQALLFGRRQSGGRSLDLFAGYGGPAEAGPAARPVTPARTRAVS